MAKQYHLRGAVVHSHGRALLDRYEVVGVLQKAFPRWMRKHDAVKRAMRMLNSFGETTKRWRVTPKIDGFETHWAQIHIRAEYRGYRIFLSGPQSLEVMRRLNRPVYDVKPHQPEVAVCSPWEIAERRKRRLMRKRKRLEEKRAKRAADTAKNQQKSRSRKVREARGQAAYAPLLRKRIDVQFKHTPIMLKEVVDIVAQTFCLMPARNRFNVLISKERIARTWLEDCMRDGVAQLREGDFVLQLAAVGGRWKGDLTVFMVACTKGKNLRYRRLRRRMRSVILGASPAIQEVRRRLVLYEPYAEAA